MRTRAVPKTVSATVLIGNVKLHQDTLVVAEVCDLGFYPEAMDLIGVGFGGACLGPGPMPLQDDEALERIGGRTGMNGWR